MQPVQLASHRQMLALAAPNQQAKVARFTLLERLIGA